MHRKIAMSYAAVLLAGACTAPAASSPDEGRLVRIEMTEYSFRPPQIILNAGEIVTLVFTNSGTLEHEFMAGTGAVVGKGYTLDWLAQAKAAESGGHDMGHSGAGVRVAPGKSARIVLNVPTQGGQFEFGCFVEGHYEGGMHGVLVISANANPASSTPAPTSTATPMPSGTHDMEGDGEAH